MTTWLVLGSSVSAPAEYERAKPFADVVITSNRGVKIEPNPDFYWCTDHVALQRYLPLIEPGMGNGTKLITSEISISFAHRYGVPNLRSIADVILDYPRAFNTNFEPGSYVNGRASGSMILQFAANQRPDRILMVGMEGYQSTASNIQVEYFDGERGGAKCKALMETYGPLVQSVIDQSPEIEFCFFGRPNYPWHGLWVVGSELENACAD